MKILLLFTDDKIKLKYLYTDSSVNINPSNILKSTMKIIMNRHADTLRSLPLKGHSFITLTNSPLSNFMMKPNCFMADSIVRFTIKARTNSLITGSLLSRKNRNNTNNDYNNICSKCGEIEILNHILNGCKHKKHLFTKRHDSVQNILRDYLTDI